MADPPALVVDASALVELVLGSALASPVSQAILGRRLHAPCHVDAEALSALARLNRAGRIRAAEVAACLRAVADTPLERHPVAPLFEPAWGLRENIRVLDALYVSLARRLGCPVLTTDARLATAAPADTWLVGGGLGGPRSAS